MALIIVLIVLVLVATLANELATSAMTSRRVASHSMHDFLLRTAVYGRRQILRSALVFDRLEDTRNSKIMDTEDEQWAWSKHDGLSEWTGESVEEAAEPGEGNAHRNTESDLLAWCEDEQGKLNLRGLGIKRNEDDPNFKATQETLVRLIDLFREPWQDLDISDSDAREMVDNLLEFLWSEADDEENPEPPTADEWRLLTLDDLLRIPGGKWTSELLYDVRNPEQTEAELSGREYERDERDEDEESDLESGTDTQWFRPNGVPGLSRFLTVYTAPGQTAGSTYTINVNTAPYALVKALFDEGDDHLAETVLEHRRQGAGASSDEEATEEEQEQGYFEDAGSLSKVEGISEETWREDHPRLAHFADVKSELFSIYVIATVVTYEGTSPEAEEEMDEEELDERNKQVLASYQYREVLHRNGEGKLKILWVERRNDPIFQE